MPNSNRSAIEAQRVLYVANSLIASLVISFFEPFRQIGLPGPDRHILTEIDIRERFGADASGSVCAEWIAGRLTEIDPTLVVFCRYSGPQASTIVEWANGRGVPTVFHIDDDLLDIPAELGAAKRALHMHPDRVGTIRHLLAATTVAYCSTEALRHRFFGKAEDRVVAGSLYCAHRAIGDVVRNGRTVIGYMGTDHTHDVAPVVPAIARLLDARPEVTFEIFGSTPIPDELKRFRDRIRVIEPVRDYPAFMDRLASLRWTIGICPLAKTPFNEVKADTKWVEYTACGFAVVASRGTVYDHACADGCGILAEGEDQWLAAFERLLDDPEAREAQVRRAQEKLRAEYSPERLKAQIEDVFAKARSLVDAAATERRAAPFSLRSVSRLFGRGEEPAPAAPAAQIHLDAAQGGRVVGWAWDPAENVEPRPEHRPLELWFGTTRIGPVPRAISRPDVDAHVGDPVGAKGFSAAAGALVALWHLLGRDPGLKPTLRLGNGTASLVEVDPAFREIAFTRTLLHATDPTVWNVVDLWWASPRLLKLRTQPRAGGDAIVASLRVLQLTRSPDRGPKLALVDEQPLPSRPDGDVVLVAVQNALMPIVLVALDTAGGIVFVDLVPFPSLLRGGLHESEPSAMAEAGGTLEDVCRLSDSYLAEQAGWGGDAPPHAVGEITFDLRRATGAEKIFDPAVRTWLAAMFALPVTGRGGDERKAADLGDGTFAEFAEAAFAGSRPPTPRAGLSRLALAGDAIPTIDLLVRRRGLPDGASAIVADEAFPSRRWLVSLPGEAAGHDCPADLPRIEGLEAVTASDAGSGDRLAPVAIVFRDLSPRTDLRLLFPVPKDQDAILVGAGAAETRISIVVLSPGPQTDLRPLLDSLAAQRAAPNCELLIAEAASTGAAHASLRDMLEHVFPGRHHPVAVETSLRTSETLNRLASEASGNTLVVLDARVVLHDERTLETLSYLAAAPRAATVGCMMLGRGRTAVASVRSCGWFPGRVDFGRAPHVALEQHDCHVLLRDSVYPVAANSGSCWAVSTAAWREVGGLSATLLPNAGAEIDLAVRLAETGRVNLCTTRLSVLLDDVDAADPSADLGVAPHLNLWRLLPALRSSTHLRAF